MGEREDADIEETDPEVEELLRTPTPPPPVQPEGKGFLAKAWGWQHSINRKWDGLGKGRVARVLRMARKPEPEELRQSAVIVLVGIAVIGGIGFLIFLLMDNLIYFIDNRVKGI